jgi:carbamoyltransferase
MNILGLHRDPWHNTGAAAVSVKDGKPRFANLAEERLDRVKDSRHFPLSSARACMEELGVESFDDLDLVVLDYIVTPDWRRDFHKKLPVSGTFLESIDQRKIRVVNHHLAHAACVYYSSPYPEAAILVVDGRGSEKETQSLFHGSPAGITLIESTKKIGIGLLYAAITQHIDFGLLQEGKTMGLAPYGEGVNKRFITYPGVYSGVETDYDFLCIEDSYALKGEHPKPTSFDDKARYAFEVQAECERAMLHLARYAKEKTGADYLCISGGVALNSVANYALLQSGLFKDIFIKRYLSSRLSVFFRIPLSGPTPFPSPEVR